MKALKRKFGSFFVSFIFLILLRDNFISLPSMKRNRSTYQNPLVFSRWSRKAYAVFASLHKEVIVASLRFDVCQSAMLKCKNIIVSAFEISVLGMNSAEGIEAEQLVVQEDMFQLLVLNTNIQADAACCFKNKFDINRSLFVA